ncbi:MAG: membrane protein insertion efficiency factor YidD [Desulfobacteraceae bacterium]|nr:MAG: membrane protein insertion efficiency factor YidD [Desulfobacteraceae bacterium]
MLKTLILICIKFYQIVISPLTGRNCRFFPSCSEYAFLAVEKHGSIKGFALAVRRIVKCHPFNPGGVDPVP